jgi:hypothetical protein
MMAARIARRSVARGALLFVDDAHEATPRLEPLDDAHYRVRHDVIDRFGKLTLRHGSRLHHIGLGRRHAGTKVLVLIKDLHIRITSTDDQPIHELELDPTRDYQPQPKRERCPETPVNGVPRHHKWCRRGT